MFLRLRLVFLRPYTVKNKEKAISTRFFCRNDIAFFCFTPPDLPSAKAIVHENAVAAGGVAYQHVGDRSHELAVLDDGGTAHECGQ